MEPYNLVSFLGIIILLGIAWLFSAHKKSLNWRVIFWGCILQLIFAFFIFIVPVGAKIFLFLNELVVRFLGCAQKGTEFVFGRLALPPGSVNENGESSLGFFLAFQGLATIVFFASLMGILYFLKVMPLFIQGFAFLFTRLMRISGAESLCTSSNIFVGIESALTIRPHLKNMTKSELTTILTAGMATVASSVLALYVFILHSQFPTIAGHLISASILSAPAALVMSKIIMPEIDKPETLGLDIKPHYIRENNLIEAAINGANAGVKLVVGVGALLLAFLGLVALVDLILGLFGNGFNQITGLNIQLSLKNLLGYIFYPLTLIIGVHPTDSMAIAKVIGERTVVTEITAYQDLAKLITEGMIHHPRSIMICTYALCGFAHVASLAIFVGGISALEPQKTKELSKCGPRALLAATLACLMTAAVAGAFYNQSSILLGQ